ncbi:fasciclin domain-containing protein [Mariniblastus sp.]|nr:fasciclin domain-containing protein [Mariniblastus sp.]
MKTALFSLALGLLTCFNVTFAQSGSSSKSSTTETAAPEGKNIVETAAEAGSFNTLLTAAKAAGLAKALTTGEYTVFAPTDEAFAKVDKKVIAELLKPENKAQLAAILSYHVVPGKVKAADAAKLTAAPTLNGQRLALDVKAKPPTVGGAKVVKTDIVCSNGIIHVVDAVIMPVTKTIPEVATEVGKFKTLLTAAKAAGLAETLGTEGPFTVFAPTDKAFAKLPEGTVEDLLKPENKDKLADILKYHVVSGRVYAADALAAKKAPTLLKEKKLKVAKVGKDVKVNDAKVVMPNVEASNGVIHVIDSVLLPE